MRTISKPTLRLQGPIKDVTTNVEHRCHFDGSHADAFKMHAKDWGRTRFLILGAEVVVKRIM